VVQGGSTITQQTAKNVFKRERRSYRAKLKELFQALLLERKYTKEEILELYANQFFVSGFGRGLQIAARYFFDKDARDLDLVESAFIAGMVKAPNRYNPFTKRSGAERSRAEKAAEERKDYVLRNMLELRFITPDQFREARSRPVPFREGQVTYRLNVILDYIREQLQSPFFQEILSREGIENIATSGIRIFTSISREMQRGALHGLRRQLPRLDVRLRGYPVGPLQDRYRELASSLSRRRVPMVPFLARITHINPGPPPSLVVSWDTGGGVIDLEGMQDVGEAWIQSRRGVWATFGPSDVPAFMELFREGDLVPVCFPGPGVEEGNGGRLCLTQIPELEGGVIVLQEGMVRAMAGGFLNRFYNRAVDAKRQLGSTFKPVVYTAALQLKWNPLDTLLNVRELYRFENTAYVPSPDHEPGSGEVSMAWAGVKSENLATVWLLYHLTDHLTLSEFREVVRRLGLHRGEKEPYQDYVRRIRDDHGVLVDRDALMEAAFDASRKSVESDVIFAGYDEALDTLRRLHFRVSEEGLDLDQPAHRRIYRHTYERLVAFNRDMKRAVERINAALENPGAERPADLKWFRLGRDARHRSRLVFLGPRRLADSEDLQPLTMADLRARPGLIQPGRVWVDGLLPSSVLDLLEGQTLNTFKELLDRQRYDLELLHRIRDFRVLVNLHYVRELAGRMGISTPLDPVLSFPLGANAVSIAEAARAYQTMMTGHVYRLNEDPSERMIPIIRRIEDREGQTIWEYVPRPRRVLSERISGMISEILRLVVEKGTGRRAREAVRLSVEVRGEPIDLPVPAFGKTGTANRYTNSSFVGFLPGPGPEGGMDLQSGFVVSTYVGYDDNRPMKGDRVTIYGSSGALPVWIETCNAVVNSPSYRDDLQIAELAFDVKPGAMAGLPDLRPVHISGRTGLPLRLHESGDASPALILSDVDVEDGTVRLNRKFDPIQ
jgi:membrane peptidoglycan carboxypeptidase